VNVLRTPEFLAGDTTTDFIERVAPARAREPDEAELVRLARLAALWIQGENRSRARVLAQVPSGWRNARLPDQKVVLDRGEESLEVRYHALRDGRFLFAGGAGGTDGADGPTARVHAWREDGIDAEVGGRRERARITRAGERLVVHGPDGDVVFTERPRFVPPGAGETPGGFVARMPGTVTLLHVKPGDSVAPGDTLLVLEAMKMEQPMRATEAGVVTEVRVAEGDQVESGALLVVVEPAAAEPGDAAAQPAEE